MSTVSSAAAARQIAELSWANGVGAALKRWWTAYIIWRMEQGAIKQLQSMSTRELKDVGISRSEILSAVREGAAPGRNFGRYY